MQFLSGVLRNCQFGNFGEFAKKHHECSTGLTKSLACKISRNNHVMCINTNTHTTHTHAYTHICIHCQNEMAEMKREH